MGNHPNSSIVGKVIIEAVENQLAVNHPPKVRKTLDRLLALWISREEAIKYIACALSVEVLVWSETRKGLTLSGTTII